MPTLPNLPCPIRNPSAQSVASQGTSFEPFALLYVALLELFPLHPYYLSGCAFPRSLASSPKYSLKSHRLPSLCLFNPLSAFTIFTITGGFLVFSRNTTYWPGFNFQVTYVYPFACGLVKLGLILSFSLKNVKSDENENMVTILNLIISIWNIFACTWRIRNSTT